MRGSHTIAFVGAIVLFASMTIEALCAMPGPMLFDRFAETPTQNTPVYYKRKNVTPPAPSRFEYRRPYVNRTDKNKKPFESGRLCADSNLVPGGTINTCGFTH